MSSETFVELKINDDPSSCPSHVDNKSETKEQQASGEQPVVNSSANHSATKKLDDAILILGRIDRDSIVNALVQASSILQGDETIEKKGVSDEIDRLLPALSSLPFNWNDTDDANANKANDRNKGRKLNRVVFELTKDERLKIVDQLMNLKSYAILYYESVMSETKSSLVKELIKENQNLINLLLTGLPFRTVKCDAEIATAIKKVETTTMDRADELERARSEALYTWKFKDVEDLFKKNSFVDSERFYCQHLRWFLSVEPELESGKKFLGVYLNVDGEERENPNGFSCNATFVVRLLGTSPRADKVKDLQYEFENSKLAYGATKLIAYSELVNPSKGYVQNGEILVQVHLKAGPLREGKAGFRNRKSCLKTSK